MDQLVHCILDRDSRLELARELLRQSAHLEPAQPRPAAALVFLLDLVAQLARNPPPADSTSTSPPAAASYGEADAASTVTANGARDPLEELPRRAADDAAGAPSVSRRGSSVQGDGPAWWDAWRLYLGEVVRRRSLLVVCPTASEPALTLPPSSSAQYARPQPDADRDDSSTPPEHPSPLFLPPTTLVHLRSALARPAFDADTRSCLLTGCAGSILRFLSPAVDPSQPHHHHHADDDADVCPALDMLMTQARPPSFPAPLPSSTTSTIALSLATTRSASTAQRAEASTRTLAALLGHYVSRAAFGAILEEEPGERAPSSSPSDRALVLGALAPSTTSSDEQQNGEDEDDADTRSIAAGIRDAHASIVRKDDKLRWLLGDNFQPGAQAAAAATSKGAPHHQGRHLHHHLHLGGGGGGASGGKAKAAQLSRAREMSGASTASSTTSAEPGDAIGGASKRHQRLTSTTSSTAPLLHDPADPSSSSSQTSSPSRPSFSPTTGRTSFLHRRVLSAGAERIHAPPPPALLSTSLDPPHAAAAPPPTPARPFADLAPAVPHVRGASPGAGPSPRRALGPPSPTSPRRVSLDSALDAQRGTGTGTSTSSGAGGGALHCDSLSAEQRRALVRRSKKLEGFFGAPIQESAAARVLVDRRPGAAAGSGVAGKGDGLGRDEVSPTSASFPAEVQPALAPSSAAAGSADPPTSTSSRRASLAPPDPTSGYAFGSPASRSSRLDARRPSALSLSASSQGSHSSLARHPSSTSTTSPSLSPRSPTGRPHLHRSSSSPSRGRRSSSFSSLAEPQHTYFSERVLADRARDERDERRRKLDKVRRVLGERVPLALVVPGEETAPAPATMGAHPMGRDRSRGGALRDRLMRRPHGHGHGGAAGGGAAGHAPEPLAGGGDAGWRYVEPQWDEGAQGGGEDGGETLKKGRPGVNALHRARKLENVRPNRSLASTLTLAA